MASGPSWSTRSTFILAAVGAAVGLGNIWKFPYMTGTNGGGAFVLVYILCVVLIAVPILIAELLIGRRGGASPPVAMHNLARSENRSPLWGSVGWLGVMAGFLILSFYSVIAGWAMAYVIKAASGLFTGLNAEQSLGLFNDLKASPVVMTLWHTAFIVLTVFIVLRGLTSGIEVAVRILMPALFAMLLAMVIYAAYAGDFAQGFAFLFSFDFSKLSPGVVLGAIGQAFFSIGVSMGLMMAYGAYLPRQFSIGSSACIIAAADTIVALLAGLAIFPLVFGNGLDPAEGPGLIFVVLPIAFGAIDAGSLFGMVFFVLLTFAALTSAIALLEPMVAWLADRGLARITAATLAGGVTWLIGLGSVASFSIWAEVYPLDFLPAFRDRTVYDLIDYFTANIMMPLGGLLIAVFVGWFTAQQSSRSELAMARPFNFAAWRASIRYIAPLAILAIFITNLN
jgi:NSS family neurotransmitter:Na+ symporter